MSKISFTQTKQSIKDLTEIYKPRDSITFVKNFMKRYNIASDQESELLEIVREQMYLNVDLDWTKATHEQLQEIAFNDTECEPVFKRKASEELERRGST